MKVLIVDDEKNIQRLFEQRFRRERRKGEIELFFAFSAEEALSFLQEADESNFKFILSDINMPQMDGLELLKLIKQDFPELEVFIISAYGDEQRRQAAQQYGATDFLNKPIDFDLLKEKLLP